MSQNVIRFLGKKNKIKKEKKKIIIVGHVLKKRGEGGLGIYFSHGWIYNLFVYPFKLPDSTSLSNIKFEHP